MNFKYGNFDQRTNFGLSTIPPGGTHSIRLGNWATGTEAESITIAYSVDSVYSILLLNYAIVLEDAGHPAAEQPRFTLEILNQSNQVIDPDCGVVDFAADKTAEGWEVAGSIAWKNWTTLGINLKEYVGETIRIRLTTYDCSQGAHYGYAYFSMDCIAAELTGLACGESEIEAVGAPEGFLYEWSSIHDRNTIVSTQRLFKPTNPQDTSTYVCKIIFPENEKCHFELSASLLPLNPVANASALYARRNCTNTVSFTNLSTVETQNGPVDRKVESVWWDFGDGQTSTLENPVHQYMDAGTYTVTLTVGINDNECEDVWTKTIEVIEIGDTHEVIDRQICEGENIIYDGKMLFEPGEHPFYFKTTAGCDSVVIINLMVIERLYTVMEDTICYGDSREFNGKTYDKTGEYEEVFTSVLGCDSIVTLKLHVRDQITFNVTSTAEIEGGDGTIVINEAPEGYWYSINGQMNGSLVNLSAGEYVIVVYRQDGCQSEQKVVTVAQDCLEAQVLAVEPYCPEESEIRIPVNIIKGVMDTYSISFDQMGLAAGFVNIPQRQVEGDYFSIAMPSDVRAGTYRVLIGFPGQVCDMPQFEVDITVLYSSSVISQRWNDVLAVKSELYNGGYSFVSYRWYKDNMLLAGENGSYLYVAEGLDMGAVYSVEMVRMGEDMAVMSCGFVPQWLDVDFQLMDNTAAAGGVYRLSSSDGGTAMVYDLMGVLVSRQVFSAGVTQIKAPEAQGYYILKVYFDRDNESKTFFINVYN